MCGGDETESFYETGSKLPGSVRNLKVNGTTSDKITIEFDPPERNSSFDLTGKKAQKLFFAVFMQILKLSGYEITAYVMRTFANNPWTIANQTWKVTNTAQHRFDLSNLLSASSYSIEMKSMNDNLDGAVVSLTGKIGGC